jgi:outer membrane protein assembly factor BamB
MAGLLCVLACAAAAWGEDSGGYRGPTGDGVYPASGLARKWPDGGPRLLWKMDPGHGWSAPAINNGTVYIAGGKQGFLYTFSLDGAPLDRYMIGGMDWKRFTGTRSVPLLSEGIAVCTSPSANIFGIDLARNETRWRVNAWKDFGSGKGSMGWGFPESPMLIGNKVVFNTCSRDSATPCLAAIDISTGKTVWTTPGGVGEIDGVKKYYSAADVSGTWAMHGGRPLVFMPAWRCFVCVDGRDGKVQFEIPCIGEKGLPPIYSDGYLLWDTGKGVQMIKLSPDGKSFTKLWERPGGGLSAGVIVGDKVFLFGADKETAVRCDESGAAIEDKPVASTQPGKKAPPAGGGANKGALLCVDRATGKLFQSRPSPGGGHIVAADGLVFVIESGPVVSLLEPCPSGFEARGSFKPTIDVGARSSDDLGSSKWIAPAISEGRLFFRYGGLYVYDLRIEPDVRGWRNDGTGKYTGNPPIQWYRGTNILWNAEVTGEAPSASVVSDGRVYVASGPGTIACMDANGGKAIWRKEEKVAGSAGAAQAAFCPVVRKDRVFAVHGGSLAACYDTAGERKWAVPVEAGAVAPPALIGEALLVPGKALVSLDAATGKQRWQLAPPAGRTVGTPALTWLRGTPVAIASWGAIVAAEDGQVLATGLADADAVLRHERAVYFAGGKDDLALSAMELPEVIADPVKPKLLWKVTLKGIASPVSMLAHREWLYVLSAGGELAVLQRDNGKELCRESLGKLTTGRGPVLTMAATATCTRATSTRSASPSCCPPGPGPPGCGSTRRALAAANRPSTATGSTSSPATASGARAAKR